MSSKHVSGLLMALCLWGGAASAQDGSGYAEESVGMVDYDDEEAAGPADATEDATSAPEGGGDVVVDGTYEDIDPDTKAQLSADATVVAAAEEEEPAVSTAPVRVSDPDRAKRPQWEWGAKRHHSSWNGTTGLMDIKEAGSGPAGTFGLGLFTGFFKYSDYLVLGDENSYMAGALNLRVTPFRFLEFHAAVKAVANRNNREYPELFQTIGDMDFGVKGFFSPVDLITLGLDFGLTFMNSIGNTAMDFSGTSVGFDALATFDFAALNEKAPLRAHLMLGYLFDNSYHLIEDIEADAGGCGSDLDGDGLIEYQGCLSPVERTALGIDRNDQLHIGIGLDALLPYVSPILEYHLDIPINRQGFTCPRIPGSFDSCMSDAGGKGMRGWLNVGARILPPLADLAIDLGVEIGLSGYAPSVHELAAQEPWMFKFGLSWQFDPIPEKPVCDTAPIPVAPVPVAAHKKGAIVAGMVHDEASDATPVGDAVILYDGMDLNPQLSSAAGRFNSYELPAGPVVFRIRAEGYVEQVFPVDVPAEGVLQMFFPMKKEVAPPAKKAVSISVLDDGRKPLSGAEVTLSGPASGTFTSDAQGRVLTDSDAGILVITAAGATHGPRTITVAVNADSDDVIKAELVLAKKVEPTVGLVAITEKRINIKKKIQFVTNSGEISPESFGLLDEVAGIIRSNPQIARIEIQGHTDDKGARRLNVELSQKRADAVKAYLVNAGVEASRLDAKGFGPDRPVAPNITSSGRAQNRRVEFHIKDAQ